MDLAVGPGRSPVAAFFDLDHTVLDTSSGSLWAKHLRREKRVTWRRMLRIAWWLVTYRLAVIDMVTVTRMLALEQRGESEAELIAESEKWYEEMVAEHVAPRARQRIEEHRARGHTVALLTASTAYVSIPAARALGLGDDYICTRLEVRNGLFTGRCIEPICYGPGKVHWAREYARARGLDLTQSYFYSDSYTDLSMLQAVGHPVAINPDARLRRYAGQHGWPIEQFH